MLKSEAEREVAWGEGGVGEGRKQHFTDKPVCVRK